MATWTSLSALTRSVAGYAEPGKDDSTKMVVAQTSAGMRARNRTVAKLPTCRFFDFIRLHAYREGMSDTTSASPAPSPSPGEKRQHLRFDKVFPVRVESILFGDISCVARNVSAGGIFIETAEPLPLGARVRICFLNPEESAEIVAIGEVKNHYFMNYSQNGVSRSVIGM